MREKVQEIKDSHSIILLHQKHYKRMVSAFHVGSVVVLWGLRILRHWVVSEFATTKRADRPGSRLRQPRSPRGGTVFETSKLVDIAIEEHESVGRNDGAPVEPVIPCEHRFAICSILVPRIGHRRPKSLPGLAMCFAGRISWRCGGPLEA